MNFEKTRFSLRRGPLSYSKVRKLAGPVARAWPFKRTPPRGAYLNIGAGPHARPDFFNLDYDYHPGIDLFWDLANPLKIADDHIGGIFSEHCLEHLPFETTQRALADFCRVMMPGAVIRISVPDAELYARAYSEGREMPFGDLERGRDPLWTPMQSVNMAFYGHGHRFLYDFATLRRCLSAAGFVDIRKERLGSGRDPRLLVDQASRERESLYVEAQKPVHAIRPGNATASD